MSLRTEMNALIDELRDLTGPAEFDIVTSQLTIRTRTWSGGRIGAEGGYDDADLVLPQKYKFEDLSRKRNPDTGGAYNIGTIAVRVVPPGDGGSGYSLAQLAPKPGADGVEIIYLVTGALAGEYALLNTVADKPFRYLLILERTRRTP